MYMALAPNMKTIQPEHYKEWEGLAETTEIDIKMLSMFSYLFDLAAICSSIVVKTGDGSIIHGRNLDFPGNMLMRNMAYIGQYYRNGKLVFEGLNIAGDVGTFTAQKAGAFSATVNWRGNHRTLNDTLENLGYALLGRMSMGMLIRHGFEEANTFQQAVKIFSNTKTCVLGYITMAGVKGYEGMIISRDHDGFAHLDQLSATNWYLVQTNDDHFAGDCQTRCALEHKILDGLGASGVTTDTLLKNVLYVCPILNRLTAYTVMFNNTGKGTFDSYASPFDDTCKFVY